MTENRRIFLNVVATYGRSVYALAIGIFTARWALNALGQTDYGLVGVVGGLAGFVSFVNGLLSFSVSRFYAVSVGSQRNLADKSAGVEDCRKWFNTALLIHTVMPVTLVIIGYPIGEWAVRSFLTIPLNRIDACLWVWRFTCISCFIGMVSVPFNAMYGAKQDIAELSIYGFATSTLNAIFLYYMITHPGVWLARYAMWTCLISSVPVIIQMIRSFCKYSECRFVKRYLFDWWRIKQIFIFGAARFWTMLSNIVSGQGNAILVNKYLGPEFNASMTLGNTVVSHTLTLSSALTGAFAPAIMNAAGEKAVEKVHRLSYQLCRIGSLLVLVFAIPLALEVNEVLVLWLKMPPPYVSELVLAILVDVVLERMSEGLYMPIIAFGDGMVRYSWWAGWCGMARFAIAWILLVSGLGIYGVCIALVVARIVVVLMRLHMGKVLAGMPIRKWLVTVLYPIGLLTCCTLFAGLVSRLIEASFCRIVLTTMICELMLLPGAWLLVLSREEKSFVVAKVRLLLRKFKR